MTAWILAYVLSSALAAGTSSYNIAHGCVERNPLAPSHPAWNAVYKGATTAGLSYTFVWVDKRHKPAGKWLAGFATSVNVLDMSMNLRARCR